MTLTEPAPTAPAYGLVVLGGADGAVDASRLDAELNGRIAVGTQVLVVDVTGVKLEAAAVGVLAGAAVRLQDERSGSLVLRNASSALLSQLRLARLDHVFELEL